MKLLLNTSLVVQTPVLLAGFESPKGSAEPGQRLSQGGCLVPWASKEVVQSYGAVQPQNRYFGRFLSLQSG